MIWVALLKTVLVRVGRVVFGEAAGDIPLDLTELAREAEDAMRPHGPKEPSQPLPYRDVERQRAQAASAARPETARPPPLPDPSQPAKPSSETPPELAWAGPLPAESFPATFPVTDVAALPGADSPFPQTLRPEALRKADTVRPGRPAPPRPGPQSTTRPSRPPPPTPAEPRPPRPLMQRASKRLPPPPRKS